MRILNLGLGVQSTTVFLLAHEREIEPIDHAIFADTQEEPRAVYEHLSWLRTVPAPVPTIHVATAGQLGEELQTGKSKNHPYGITYHENHRHRFASIPAFTATHHERRGELVGCDQGRVPRQCTKDYKTEVVERTIRRIILGLLPRQRIPKGVRITQIFGISWDERRRAERIRERVAATGWATAEFPLLERHWTRDDCKGWLKSRVPYEVPRSACVFCPFKSAGEWATLKQHPEDWQRAVEIDNALRAGAMAQKKFDKALYVHRRCIPLEMVDVEAEAAKESARKAAPLFSLMDCGEGMCGV